MGVPPLKLRHPKPDHLPTPSPIPWPGTESSPQIPPFSPNFIRSLQDSLDPDPGFETEAALQTWHFHSALLPLPEQRDVTVHLPPQYDAEPTRRFPVFYLHDGQNLFDPRLSYVPARTWQAHTTADRLALAGETEPVILVGIANSGLRRMAEYTPSRDLKLGGGEGRTYGRVLIEEIKPFIDATYRTSPEAARTGLGGASLGGLISLYLGFEHPDVFSRIAVMSPSIWWDQRSILNLIAKATPRPNLRIWLDMGTAEGLRHLRDTDLLHQRLLKRGWRDGIDLAYQRDPGAIHDEQAWAGRFPNVLRFLFPPR
jgi:predicted alpha/beta superfamily hydrolase